METNKIENRKTVEKKSIKPKVDYLKKNNKIDNPLTRLTKKKR